jgi:hypothetical protein
MSFAAITLCVASQRVFIVVSVYFVIDSVRKLLDTPSYQNQSLTPMTTTGGTSVLFILIVPSTCVMCKMSN